MVPAFFFANHLHYYLLYTFIEVKLNFLVILILNNNSFLLLFFCQQIRISIRMFREAWRDAVHGVKRVGHNLATEQQ